MGIFVQLSRYLGITDVLLLVAKLSDFDPVVRSHAFKADKLHPQVNSKWMGILWVQARAWAQKLFVCSAVQSLGGAGS